jgi:hypothetical protein
MGTSRRARVFEIFAPTWIKPPGKIHVFPIQCLDLGNAQAAKSPMEWKAKRSSSFDSARSADFEKQVIGMTPGTPPGALAFMRRATLRR